MKSIIKKGAKIKVISGNQKGLVTVVNKRLNHQYCYLDGVSRQKKVKNKTSQAADEKTVFTKIHISNIMLHKS